MKLKLKFFAMVACFGFMATQAHADTLQSLAVESQIENTKLEAVYEKIKDPSRTDHLELRCNDLVDLTKKRININERAKNLASKEHKKSFQDQIDTHKKFLKDLNAEFNCG